VGGLLVPSGSTTTTLIDHLLVIPYDHVISFNINVPDEQLHKLRSKLDLTRLLDELDLLTGQER
jgi:hypothetical protein